MPVSPLQPCKKGINMLSDFKALIAKGNVMGLAVGVIIGAVFGAIVNSLTDEIIMPIISAIFGNTDFLRVFTLSFPVMSHPASRSQPRVRPGPM
jgi:large-conductance mechanosensitive channel